MEKVDKLEMNWIFISISGTVEDTLLYFSNGGSDLNTAKNPIADL